MKKDSRQPCIMVCVTPQHSCARLIEAGARIANQENLPLSVISVFKEKNGLNANEGGALENLFECAKKFNAGMNIYFNDSPELVVAVSAKKNNASTLVTGFPAEGSSGFIARIHEILPELPITMVDNDSNEYKIIPVSEEEIKRAKELNTSSVH
ncbi:MAG: hypothetical protein SPI97_01660 [Oscillospiraceae bacterium]|nr:hypothetical protein [Oscillospiraceae bacterium]